MKKRWRRSSSSPIVSTSSLKGKIGINGEVKSYRPGEKWTPRFFYDFYLVDNSLTRNTKGTAIGPDQVKKFVIATGGTVSTANNDRIDAALYFRKVI